MRTIQRTFFLILILLSASAADARMRIVGGPEGYYSVVQDKDSTTVSTASKSVIVAVDINGTSVAGHAEKNGIIVNWRMAGGRLRRVQVASHTQEGYRIASWEGVGSRVSLTFKPHQLHFEENCDPSLPGLVPSNTAIESLSDSVSRRTLQDRLLSRLSCPSQEASTQLASSLAAMAENRQVSRCLRELDMNPSFQATLARYFESGVIECKAGPGRSSFEPVSGRIVVIYGSGSSEAAISRSLAHELVHASLKENPSRSSGSEEKDVNDILRCFSSRVPFLAAEPVSAATNPEGNIFRPEEIGPRIRQRMSETNRNLQAATPESIRQATAMPSSEGARSVRDLASNITSSAETLMANIGEAAWSSVVPAAYAEPGTSDHSVDSPHLPTGPPYRVSDGQVLSTRTRSPRSVDVEASPRSSGGNLEIETPGLRDGSDSRAGARVSESGLVDVVRGTGASQAPPSADQRDQRVDATAAALTGSRESPKGAAPAPAPPRQDVGVSQTNRRSGNGDPAKPINEPSRIVNGPSIGVFTPPAAGASERVQGPSLLAPALNSAAVAIATRLNTSQDPEQLLVDSVFLAELARQKIKIIRADQQVIPASLPSANAYLVERIYFRNGNRESRFNLQRDVSR